MNDDNEFERRMAESRRAAARDGTGWKIGGGLVLIGLAMFLIDSGDIPLLRQGRVVFALIFGIGLLAHGLWKRYGHR